MRIAGTSEEDDSQCKLGSGICLRSGTTYLICSPTKFICSNASLLDKVVCRDLTYMVLGPEVSRHIQLVHINRGRGPARALERIEYRASPVIFARVLIPRHVSMDFNHCVQNLLDVFIHIRGKRKTKVRACIACQHDNTELLNVLSFLILYSIWIFVSFKLCSLRVYRHFELAYPRSLYNLRVNTPSQGVTFQRRIQRIRGCPYSRSTRIGS